MNIRKGAVKGNTIVFDEPLGLPDGKQVNVDIQLFDDGRERVLDREYAVYNSMKEQLEAEHHLEWVVIHKDEFVGTFKDFEDAINIAVRRFGRGPYLVKRIGAPPVVLPASIGLRRVYADD